jgi:hypothetical protein
MMRFLIWALAFNVLVLWLLIGPAPAGSDSSYHCPGFEPYPPVGCKGPPRCLCDSENRCGWVFACDGN